jgi:hypothetical protein
MNRWGRRIAGLVLLLAGARVADAEVRFAVDPRLDLGELARSGRVAMAVERRAGLYTVDVSAVIHGRGGDVMRVALDYDGHARLGVPQLRESRLVARPAGEDVVYAWASMSGLGRSSKHYVRIRVCRDVGPPGASGLEWTLTDRQPGWPYEQASAFVRLDGSWYVEPLGERASYLRYVVWAVPDPTVPDALVGWLIERELRAGARALVEAVVRAVATR